MTYYCLENESKLSPVAARDFVNFDATIHHTPSSSDILLDCRFSYATLLSFFSMDFTSYNITKY
jgi:hypothetical protein